MNQCPNCHSDQNPKYQSDNDWCQECVVATLDQQKRLAQPREHKQLVVLGSGYRKF